MGFMERFLRYYVIFPCMEIFIRPRKKEMRRWIYEQVDDKGRLELQEKIFLPESAYPKPKGRKPVYDFLYIWVEGIDEDKAKMIKLFLNEKTDRPVFYYHTKLVNKEAVGYVFILPWRDVKTGKALPNKLGYFNNLRDTIYKIANGKLIVKKAEKKPEYQEEAPKFGANIPKIKPYKEEVKEEKRELTPEDIELLNKSVKKKLEELDKKREYYREKYREALDEKIRIEAEINSIKAYGGFYPLSKSKLKKLEKRLQEVKREIEMWKYLYHHPEKSEEDYLNSQLYDMDFKEY